MDEFEIFMRGNTVGCENEKFILSHRFLDGENKEVFWEIKAISASEDEEIRKLCLKKDKDGKVNFDNDLYLGKLAAKCVVYPNLNNAALQDGYSVMGADSLLKSMLKPGEYAQLIKRVKAINGFDIGLDEKVKYAKK